MASAALALLVAACSSSSSTKSSSGIPSGPIKLAVITSLSGPLAEFGAIIKNGYQAGANYINAHGGIAGHQIDLIVENDAGDPAQNLTAGRKLIAEHVVGVLEPGFDGINTGTQALLEGKGIPEVWPINQASQTNSAAHPHMFAIEATDVQHEEAIATAVHEAGFTRVTTISDASSEGTARQALFSKDAAKYGIKVIANEVYPVGSSNVTPEVSAAEDSHPQALVLAVTTSIPQLLSAMGSLRWYPVTFADYGLYSGGNTVGAPAAVLAHAYADCPTYIPTATTPVPPAVVAVGQEIQRLAPGSFGAYDSAIGDLDYINVFKYAITKANSVNPSAIVKAIETIKNQSFAVPWMKYTFSSSKNVGDTYDPMCGVAKFGPGDLPIPTTTFK